MCQHSDRAFQTSAIGRYAWLAPGSCSAILPNPEGLVLEAVKITILFVSAIFPIVNPLGGSPIFLALTSDYSRSSRRLLSQRIAMNSFILLVVSSLIGTHILAFFGISLPIVQVGGGLIVIATGWAMLERKDEDDRERGKQSRLSAEFLKTRHLPP